jgi:hypothetical protein
MNEKLFKAGWLAQDPLPPTGHILYISLFSEKFSEMGADCFEDRSLENLYEHFFST